MHAPLPDGHGFPLCHRAEMNGSSISVVTATPLGCRGPGGALVSVNVGSLSVQMTFAACGVPVIATTPSAVMPGPQPDAQWASLYVSHSVAVPDVSVSAGTIRKRVVSGANTATCAACPASRSDFWRTCVSEPVKVDGFGGLPEKSFQETTTLSVLTPIMGWSPMSAAPVASTYLSQVPVGSDVSETAM